MHSTFTGSAGAYRFTLLAGAAAFALALPGAALAQDGTAEAEAEDLNTGNQIIVTATKRAQTLQETPVAVSVTSAETIEQAQIRDIADLSSVVPSLRVSQLQSAFATTFSVRGFGTDGNNLGLEPSVAVFVDGVYRSRAVSQISDLPNLQRVEVLRGPQSTLFGKNASAGVISLVTKAPSFELEGSAEVSYGNYDAIVARGYISGPISDTIAVSVAGGINKRDGFVTSSTTGDDLNDRDRWFTRGEVMYDNNDNFTFRLIGDWDEIDEKCCAVTNLRRSDRTAIIDAIVGGPSVNPPGTELNDVVSTDVIPFNRVRNWGISGQADYEFADLTLTSITAYRDTRIRANQDVDFTAADIASGANIGQADIETFTQELRIASDFDGMFNFLVGGYYFKEDLQTADQIIFGEDFRPYANGLILGASEGLLNLAAVEQLLGAAPGTFFAEGQGFFNSFQQDNEAYSIFGQVDLDLTDRLTVTLGANYTKDKKDVTSNSRTTDAFSQLDLNSPLFAGSRQFLLTSAGVPAGLAAFLAANPTTTTLPDGVTPLSAVGIDNANPFAGLRDFQFLRPVVNIPNAVESGRTRDDEVTYLARANYEVTDTLNVYVSYATGFKASSFNLSRDSRPTAGDLPRVIDAGLGVPNLVAGSRFALPEESTVYELGIKGNWDVAAANFTVFNQKLENFQSNIFVGDFFTLVNAGEVETFGIEFDGYVRPTDSLTLSLALTYLDAKYNSFPLSPVGDLSGQDVAGVHPLSASFGATWDKELGNGDRLILRGDFQYESPVQVIDGLTNFRGPNDGTPDNEAAQAAAREFVREVNNFNASITYAFDMGLEVSLWGRNILDDRYITTIFPSVAQGTSISGYPNLPRTYGGLIRYRF